MERMWSKLGLGQKIRSACQAVCFGMFSESLMFYKQLILSIYIYIIIYIYGRHDST